MVKRQWRRSAKQLRSKQVWGVRLLFWGAAVVIGLVATALAVLSEYASSLVLYVTHRWYRAPVLLTPLGLMLIAWLTRRYFPAAEGSGIPQTIAMLQVSEKFLKAEIGHISPLG